MPPSEDPASTVGRRCIAATLGLALDEVEKWDSGPRQGAYDIRYRYDGRTVAVETKSVVDFDLQLTSARIRREPFSPAPQLGRRWTIVIEHDADVRLVRAELPDVLEELEARGWVDRVAFTKARRAGFAGEFDRLGVTGMWSRTPAADRPAGIVLQPRSVGAFEEAIPDLSTFVSELLSDDTSQLVRDLRRQLNTSDVDERHAFLVVGHEHTEGWPLTSRRRGTVLPSHSPRLPAPIDGLWLATFSVDTRVVAALPGVGWIEGRNGVSPIP